MIIPPPIQHYLKTVLMHTTHKEQLEDLYPVSCSILEHDLIERLASKTNEPFDPEDLADILEFFCSDDNIPDFIPELARLEWTFNKVKTSDVDLLADSDATEINPSLEVVDLSWKLSSFLTGSPTASPEKNNEWALIWKDPTTGEVRVKAASSEDLLALKMIAEDLALDKAAEQGNVPVECIWIIFSNATKEGILIEPRSCIRRRVGSSDDPEEFQSADTFTLQWHITNTCDLHCKHCYDRSERSPLTLNQALGILNDMRFFCKKRHVQGHVCFTGGNPFMHVDFFDIYAETVKRGFSTSILGNPVPREKIQKLINIRKPFYFQVSLEGLEEHNDHIRGKGHFLSIIEFLEVLRDLNVSTAVMLTLTKDNIDQVIPLAEKLRGHTEYFTFNRLSRVGEGANLFLPTPKKYEAFLELYVKASENNHIIGFKDNLINITLHNQGSPTFDGCTGYGCGAAFNFLTVLPDGETHACRKFPSPVGNVVTHTIADVYDSRKAALYRKGPSECTGCALVRSCKGCMAISHSQGLDVFKNKDPYCFIR
ncbi:MAG: thio(seleno)oxazole modification radical SAM maturase SbtM [Candidatus Tantalella remota]|nr:thio(seleno)oxazole modification radical SAM maturase SbtM [Candidatus Tantalella remota]